MPYSAYVISPESRALIIKRHPALFPEQIAHHITYRFPDQERPPPVGEVRVVGYAKDISLGLECLVVSIDGTSERPSGGIYHITLSLDRSLGAKPVLSNRILESGWERLESTYRVEVEPTLLSS